jgi:Ca2+-binding RTX toxin-like protein
VASVFGSGGSDFFHLAGDGLTAPVGYVDITYVAGDVVVGNGGDDIFVGSGSSTRYLTDFGYDVLDYSGFAEGVRIDNDGGVYLRSNGAFIANFATFPGRGFQELRGTAFDDTLVGTEDNTQVLIGNGGNDTLTGSTGNETLDGGAGDDTLSGGEGIDVATYAAATASVTVSLLVAGAQDTGGAGVDQLVDIENLTGSAFADTLTGNDAANTLAGGGGNDVLSGRDGDDTLLLRGSEGAAFGGTLDGGAGSGDTLEIEGVVNVTTATMRGVEGVRFAGSATSIVSLTDTEAAGLAFTGRAGLIDRAVIHLTSTVLDYSAVVFSDMDSFSFFGTAGDDSVTGTAISDFFRAAGGGADTLMGGGGNDRYAFDQPGVTIVEADAGGSDCVYVSIDYTLADNVENLVQTGSAGIQAIGNALANTMVGNGGANDLQGLAGNDALAGGGGNDTIDGGAGSDKLNGNDGDDRLVGGSGRDTLWGGNGADTFVLSNTVADADKIFDFAVGTDKLEISEALFGQDFGAGPGLDAAVFRNNTSGMAQDADDRFIYSNLNGALYFDADGSGAGARVLIASLYGSPDTLAATEFLLA